jgi:PII-like signaling protein
MNGDCLKLTCYFGERHRARYGFVADELLDVYERHHIASSIVLRGVEGFGLKHQLRSDRSLSLSEDLPAVTVAVDTRTRIEGVLDEVTSIDHVGLVSLERARLITDDIQVGPLPESLHEATKLTIYLGRQARAQGVPAYVGVCDLLHRHGIAGATVLLGVDGTVRGVRQRAGFFGRNADVPAMVIAIGSGPSVAQVLPRLGEVLDRPLISVERVRICKRDGQTVEQPHALPGTDEHGMALWQKLSIITSEAAQHQGQPIHRAITRQLRATGASGATTLRGTWGFHGDHRPHGDRPLRVVRHVPTLTVVIDTPDRIAESFSVIDEITQDRALVTAEMVPALRTRSEDRERGGLNLADHDF